MATAEQLAEYRAAVNSITAVAFVDISNLLAQIDTSDPIFFRDRLRELMPELLGPYVEASGELSGAFYESLRADVLAGAFYAQTATALTPDRIDALTGYAVSPLFKQSNSTVLNLLAGGSQRIIANAGRDTISLNAARDRVGFQRVPAAGCCAFCAMVASRGAAYSSSRSAGSVIGRGVSAESTAGKRGGQGKGAGRTRGTQSVGDKYHDFCRCVVAPVFVGDTWSSEIAEAYSERYTGLGEGEPDLEILARVRAENGLR